MKKLMMIGIITLAPLVATHIQANVIPEDITLALAGTGWINTLTQWDERDLNTVETLLGIMSYATLDTLMNRSRSLFIQGASRALLTCFVH